MQRIAIGNPARGDLELWLQRFDAQRRHANDEPNLDYWNFGRSGVRKGALDGWARTRVSPPLLLWQPSPVSEAFRRNKAPSTWLRIGEIRATSMECAPFDREGLNEAILDMRALTRDRQPSSWWLTLTELCSEVGVAVVAEPEIKGARINGAARWLTPTKALVQLSLRHRWSDIFWFTFFHEVGHLLMHSKKEMFINDVGAHSGVEQEADAFASQILIPRSAEPELSTLNTAQDVDAFADRIGIAPGIVVGRLQHEGRWPYNRGNELKQRFVFVE